MKKKLLIVGGIVVVLGIVGVILLNSMWGEYESKLEKSEIEVTDSLKTASTPSFNELSGTYVVDAAESDNAELLFHLDGLKNTKGAFEKFTASLVVENSVESAIIEVVIDAASINTGNSMRDEHLRTEEGFFLVDQYPEILFSSNNITWKDGIYTANGELTLMAETKALNFDFKHIGGGENKSGQAFEAFEGEFMFDRTEYGMPEESGVGNEVTMNFYLELVKK